jgi:hypothetical protein
MKGQNANTAINSGGDWSLVAPKIFIAPRIFIAHGTVLYRGVPIKANKLLGTGVWKISGHRDQITNWTLDECCFLGVHVMWNFLV